VINKTFILVFIAECWITIGQICFKKSANHLDSLGPGAKPWVTHLLGFVRRTPAIWLGGLAMLTGLLFWFAALSSGALSFVYLLGSMQYIFTLVAAHYFLQEKIDTTKLIGTLLITLGIILTALST